MKTSTCTMTARDSRFASARSKGLQGDARKDERAAFGRAVRRAGRVSVSDALDELADEDDFALELKDAAECAYYADNAHLFTDEAIAALVAQIDAQG